MRRPPRRPRSQNPRATGWFAAAAVAGGCHAAITLTWAVGGKALLWTLGDSFVAKFSDIMWVLFPLALVKALAAFGPLWLACHDWPVRRAARFVCSAASALLVLWGGANTLLGNGVLLGLIHPDGGFDRSAMIGHAWIWDPLFLVWGSCLAAGLWATRRATQQAR